MTADTPPSLRDRLARARHDLRTPVNAILGYAEMLLEEAEGVLDAGPGGLLRELHLFGTQIHNFVNKLLAEEYLADVTEARLPILAAAVQKQITPHARGILERCRRLLADPAVPASFHDDLKRISTAGDRLLALLQDPFADRTPKTQPASGAAPAETPASGPAGRGHVLVVDDNDFSRDMLARLLARAGHTSEAAADGRQALDLLRARPFDLVLLDVLMPELDGFAVLQQLKADADLKHVPVIMISALDDIAGVVRCIEMGAEDYLPKPFDPVLLRARVGACLEQKRLRDQELDYLRNVAVVTEAASAMEAGRFELNRLQPVADRTDPLGQLARVFLSMAREVQAREQRLRLQVQQLRVEIDEARKDRQVSEITESAYFQGLKEKVERMKKRPPKPE